MGNIIKVIYDESLQYLREHKNKMFLYSAAVDIYLEKRGAKING
jgi:hypothetical protein